MEAWKKYRRRRLMRATLYVAVVITLLKIIENNPPYKWVYIAVGVIVLAAADLLLRRGLQVDVLSNEAEKDE